MAVINSKKANMILVCTSDYTLLAVKVTKASLAKSESKSNILTLAGLQRGKSCGIPFLPTRKNSYASHVIAPPGQLSFKLPSTTTVHANAEQWAKRKKANYIVLT